MHTYPATLPRARARRRPEAASRAGFSLIELTAVIVIIGILLVFLVPRLMTSREEVERGATRAFLTQLGAILSNYEIERGDYPPSSFDASVDVPNKINVGAEALVVSLFSGDVPRPNIPEDRLGNTDGDATKRSITTFPEPALLELVDHWGNPIAYIHRRDYEEEFIYQTDAGASGVPLTGKVKAIKNSLTGDFFHATKYQLISAGPDGEFGTRDDVFNFDYEPSE